MRKNVYFIRLTVAIIFGIISVLMITGICSLLRVTDLQFTALIQRVIFDFSVTALVIFCAVVAATFLFGRFYCSVICPFGILQELAALLIRKRDNETQKSFGYKYLLSALFFGSLIGGSALLIRYFDPYTVFGKTFSLTVFGLIFTVLVLVLVFFKNRFFCTNICPVGTVLGLIAKFSPNKMYMKSDECIACGICSKNCPTGSIDHYEEKVNNETCIKCMKCFSVCPKGAMKYGNKKETAETVETDESRRRFLWLAGSLVMLGAGCAAGFSLAKNFAKKIKDIILPPGAVNVNYFANKCLNCNLCVANCPNKIIKKADKDFNAVHLDYSQGKKYCEYNCNKCSEVCPSGAIKKISLEEKQKTRIAIAVVNSETCHRCRTCVRTCPIKAITGEKGKSSLVDASKCIGCGMCKAACPYSSIEIYTINEQQKNV